MNDYVTRQQFNDFSEKIDQRFAQVFLRFDEHDQMFGLIFKKFDRLEEKLDRGIRDTNETLKELREMNTRMDARIASLEDWRKSIEH